MKTKIYTLLSTLMLIHLGVYAQTGHLPEIKDQKVIPVLPQRSIKEGKVVRYDLYVKDTIVNYGGKPKRAIAVNGQIPMPTLTFIEGDTAEIVVHNLLDEETALHWHGVWLPNKEDGVPWLTQKPKILSYRCSHSVFTE